MAQLPAVLVERLRHYFSTYKLLPDTAPLAITPYDKRHAHDVIRAAMQDYQEVYGGPLGS
jgi:inorganic pyrophosphatase